MLCENGRVRTIGVQATLANEVGVNVGGEGAGARKPSSQPRDPQSISEVRRDGAHEGIAEHGGDVEAGVGNGGFDRVGEVGEGGVEEEVDLFQRVVWGEDVAVGDAVVNVI